MVPDIPKEHADKLPASLLVLPHHGSMASSVRTFVEAVHPRYAVFTAGYLNRFGLPKEVVERYRKTHRRYWTHASRQQHLTGSAYGAPKKAEIQDNASRTGLRIHFQFFCRIDSHGFAFFVIDGHRHTSSIHDLLYYFPDGPVRFFVFFWHCQFFFVLQAYMQEIRYALFWFYRGDGRYAPFFTPFCRRVVIMKDGMCKSFCINVVRTAYIEYVLHLLCRKTHFIGFTVLFRCHFVLPLVHSAFAGKNFVDESFSRQ